MKRALPLVASCLLLVVTAPSRASPTPSDTTADDASRFTVVPVSDVRWEPLNPARGDKSPQAGTLWGDRKGEQPTGFLAKFVDGFSSPPHIHNATYRAVVLDGEIHNDDPAAARMWMPAGSFWTQPKGEVHITAARGARNIALVEIDRGPYLVKPPDDRFGSGERPVNIVPSNLVWVTPDGWSHSTDGPKVSYLWGNLDEDRANGTFLKLPAGFVGALHTKASTFRAVVIHGTLRHALSDRGDLLPGSYFGSSDELVHELSTTSECLVYIRTVGRYALHSRHD